MLKGIYIIRGQRFLIHFFRFIRNPYFCLCMTKLQYLTIKLYLLCIQLKDSVFCALVILINALVNFY